MSPCLVCCCTALLALFELWLLWRWRLPVRQPVGDEAVDRALDRAFLPFANKTFTEDELRQAYSLLENVCVFRIAEGGMRVHLVHNPGWGCREFQAFVSSALLAHGAVVPTLFGFNRLDEPRVLALDDDVLRGALPRWSSTWDSGTAAMRAQFPHASATGARLLDLVVRKAQWLNLSTDARSLTDVLFHPMLSSPAQGRKLLHVAVPLFSMATVRDRIFEDIAVPDIYHAAFTRAHPHMIGLAEDRPARFAAKAATLYWRGSTTGGTLTPETAEAFPRVRAVRRARAFCDANRNVSCDVHFTAVIQALPGMSAKFADDPILRPVGDADVFPFASRFLLDVDGNSFSSRLVPFLLSHCVVVRFSSGVRQWFSHWMQPDTHWHAVALDASNFSDVLQRVVQLTDAEHEAMIERANELARRHLTLDAAQQFMRRALLRWAKLLVVDHQR
jgi:hypothetical protein